MGLQSFSLQQINLAVSALRFEALTQIYKAGIQLKFFPVLYHHIILHRCCCWWCFTVNNPSKWMFCYNNLSLAHGCTGLSLASRAEVTVPLSGNESSGFSTKQTKNKNE